MANFQKIKTIATEKGISMTKLAEEIGMTPNGLAIVIKTNKTMTDKLEAIARVLGVRVSTFFEDEPVNEVVPSDQSELRELIAQKDDIIAQKDKIIEQKDSIINTLIKR